MINDFTPRFTAVPNYTPLTWSVWGVLTTIMLLIIVFVSIWQALSYKKKGKSFLTVRKITIFSTFLALFLIQAFLTKSLLKLPIPFSVDSITTIAIGFIFGPLEGILFGWVADSLRVLINGWSYQFLPSLMYPMIGLIAGLFGLLYNHKGEINKWKSILILQVAIISLFTFMLPLEYMLLNGFMGSKDIDKKFYATLSTTIGTLLLMEGLFLYVILNKVEKKEMFLLMLIIVVAYADRIMELIIRPFTQYFSGYESNYGIALFTRMLSSTYLIPSVSLASFVLIKTTFYVMNTK